MDEPTLFDRFHEALDIEPRPGAYERLRTQFAIHPVALRRGLVFRIRFTKTAFRMVAAMVAILMAIALIGTFIAVHNRSVGEVPAQPDPNVKTFRALMVADYNAFNASTSDHCATIDDPGCAAALTTVSAALQKWADDINAFPITPAPYRALASALRAHLLDVIKDANAVIAFQKAGDIAGFNFVMRGAYYERAWLDPAVSVIEGNYEGASASYSQAIATAKRAVLACLGTTPGPDVLACNRLQGAENCDGAQKQVCEGDVENALTLIQLSLVDLAQNPAQSSKYMHIHGDLASADASLLSIHDALVGGNSTAVNTAESNFLGTMTALASDLAAN